MEKDRNQYYDFLRGIAIIMVVGIHTEGQHCGFDSLTAQLNTILRQFLNAGVPVFFAISGFFLSRKDLTTNYNRSEFWKKQIPKVYIPALIWGLPWFALGLYGKENFWLQLLLWLCCGLSIFYFIAVTIQNYLLLPILQKMPPPLRNVVAIIISLMSITFITWIRAFEGINLPLIVYAGFVPLWIIFFVMGVSLSQYKRTYNLNILFVFFICSVICQFFESWYIESIGGYGYGIKPSSFVYSGIIILVLFSKRLEELFNRNNFLAKLIVGIGNISFGIYLTHYLIIFVLNMFPYSHLWFVDWLLVLLFDILFIYILKKIIPIRFYKYLGL